MENWWTRQYGISAVLVVYSKSDNTYNYIEICIGELCTLSVCCEKNIDTNCDCTFPCWVTKRINGFWSKIWFRICKLKIQKIREEKFLIMKSWQNFEPHYGKGNFILRYIDRSSLIVSRMKNHDQQLLIWRTGKRKVFGEVCKLVIYTGRISTENESLLGKIRNENPETTNIDKIYWLKTKKQAYKTEKKTTLKELPKAQFKTEKIRWKYSLFS